LAGNAEKEDRRAADAAILAGIADGDEAALAELMEAEAPRLLRFCRGMLGNLDEAEDVVQEAFVRLWETARAWRPDARLGTWLHTVCHNRCVDRLRRRKAFVEERVLLALADEEQPADARLIRREAVRALRAAIDALPHRQRAAVLLFHFQDLAQSDAARVLGVSDEAFESLLARGRRRLRAVLASGEVGDE
jgi:RNA polymerase sigma-70 factor (ECF subfamily)